MGAMAFCSPIVIKSIAPIGRCYGNPLPCCVKMDSGIRRHDERRLVQTFLGAPAAERSCDQW